MKFPARKKRATMSAHMAATSPYGPRAATAVRQHTDVENGEARDGFIQKYSLRRRHKSEDLRRDSECDAELVATTSSSDTICLGSSASLPLPALILTPASTKTRNPLPTRRRTVHGNGDNGDNAQKKMTNPPRSSTMANLTSFASQKSAKVVQKIRSVFQSRRSDETLRPSKKNGGQETEDDQADCDADDTESNAQHIPPHEATAFLVPPRLHLDLGPEW